MKKVNKLLALLIQVHKFIEETKSHKVVLQTFDDFCLQLTLLKRLS